MLYFILACVLFAVTVCLVIARKTGNLVPVHELKRQAADGNELARQLYRCVGFGQSYRTLSWGLLIAGYAGSVSFLAAATPGWLLWISVAVMTWLLFVWLPRTRVTSLSIRLTKLVTSPLAWLLQRTDRPLQTISRPFARRSLHKHSGLFEVEDLLDLLDLQAGQADSRIDPDELLLVRQALKFNGTTVREVLRPRSDVKSVSATDAIGPILLDELHATDQTSFPVKKTPKGKEFVGLLHLDDVGIHSSGTVGDHMIASLTIVQDDEPLAQVLRQFHKTKQQLFLVHDNFDAYVGIITLEDVIERLTGLSAQVEPVAEPGETVVE